MWLRNHCWGVRTVVRRTASRFFCVCGVFSCVSRVRLQLFKASHRVSESCYRIRKFSGVEKKMVCSCVDDNGKLWRIMPGVAARREKLGRFLLFLKYSRLFLSCICRNLPFFMLMNKKTCCYSLDDDVLVFFGARARVCVYTRPVTWYHLEFIYIYWNPSLFHFQTSRVCVLRYAFASCLLRGQNRKYQNFHIVK